MGICASCLGLNRHPSQDIEETDPLLDDSRPAQYGSIVGRDGDDVAQPDEEELRRDREALELITAEAAENMIDVSHRSSADISHHIAYTNHDRQATTHYETNAESEDPAGPEDAEEAAWLQSIQSDGLDSVTGVKGLQSGALVLDISQLRQEPSPSSARKAPKSAIR
ncbi:hypothetical protein LTR36_006407 [Oleoguttula mirabilis]|uniref:Late endosomal/lysosomal adaptor and MAPK and MTOR activator-domain-containing protein n=1 Tax=Oleoguttula mirabilis TaxID=1507867 RepID=A0AAV9JWF7_9PEZI|nr:hypothetical protein LTR36_006407 [Oleoguttula mirabilis]